MKDGFLTDLVSDPTGIFNWLWKRKWRWLRNALESVALSAIVHDRLREDLDFTKPSTDLIFVDALYARKVWPPLTWFLFIAVWTNKSRRRTMPA